MFLVVPFFEFSFNRFGKDCTKFLKKDIKKEEFFVRLMARGAMMVMDENEFIDWCITELDLDGNGEASWEEFETFIRSHDTWEKFQSLIS